MKRKCRIIGAFGCQNQVFSMKYKPKESKEKRIRITLFMFMNRMASTIIIPILPHIRLLNFALSQHYKYHFLSLIIVQYKHYTVSNAQFLYSA